MGDDPQPLLLCPPTQAADHGGRVVDRRHLRAAAREVQRQRARPAADVDHAGAGGDADPLRQRDCEPRGRGLRHLLIVAAEVVPRVRAADVGCLAHIFYVTLYH